MAQLEEEADQAQDERQEEEVILSAVVGQIVGRVALVAQMKLVDEFDAAFPVAPDRVARRVAVQVVLPAYEIPHEVADIHVVHLIVEEEAQVVLHRGHLEIVRLVVQFGTAGDSLGDIALVEFFVTLVETVPHAREEHFGR